MEWHLKLILHFRQTLVYLLLTKPLDEDLSKKKYNYSEEN